MTKNTYKIVFSMLLGLFVAAPAFAANEPEDTETSNFRVDLTEILSVEVSSSTVSASGNTNATGDTFLKNFTQLHVQTNNASGFSATMTAKTTETALKNTADSTKTIPTLSSNVSETSFPANNWGFSLNGSNANTAVYHPIVASTSATPSVIAKTSSGADSYTNSYFGAKGNSATTAGTYANTVVIAVTAPPATEDTPVTPIDDPVEPVTPVTPTNDTPTPAKSPARSVAQNTPTESDEPDASDAHEEPQGVIEDTTTEAHITNSNSSMSLATGVTVTAAAGIIFFILAKRKEDDEDEN